MKMLTSYLNNLQVLCSDPSFHDFLVRNTMVHSIRYQSIGKGSHLVKGAFKYDLNMISKIVDLPSPHSESALSEQTKIPLPNLLT